VPPPPPSMQHIKGVTGPLTAESEGFVPIIGFECRGLEPTDFKPRVGDRERVHVWVHVAMPACVHVCMRACVCLGGRALAVWKSSALHHCLSAMFGAGEESMLPLTAPCMCSEWGAHAAWNDGMFSERRAHAAWHVIGPTPRSPPRCPLHHTLIHAHAPGVQDDFVVKSRKGKVWQGVDLSEG
jgi:hypothetical protein